MLRRFLTGTLLGLMITSFAIFTGVKAPHLHRLFLTKYVGSKVYWIYDAPMQGGGTGFAVKAPSGKTYVVSNDHVCDASDDDHIYLQDDKGRLSYVKILERSQTTDLCLLEAPKGVEGLEVSPKVVINDQVWSVGHPDGLPMSVQTGDILGQGVVGVTVGRTDNVAEDCNAPKFFPQPAPNDGKPGRYICISMIDSYSTNMVIIPGNSGSPAVDAIGRVVAVVYAANGEYHWGYLVTHKDLLKFLKNR